jgi:limonene 1,2-monooxygenase
VNKDSDFSKPDEIIDILNDSGIAVIGTPDRMIDTINRFHEQTGGFGTFLSQHHDLANREATNYSHELFMRQVAPHFQGSNVRSQANISWIENQDGRFVDAAAKAWSAARDRYDNERNAPVSR